MLGIVGWIALCSVTNREVDVVKPLSRRVFLAGGAGLVAAACGSSSNDGAPDPGSAVETTTSSPSPATSELAAAPAITAEPVSTTTTAAIDLGGEPFTLGVASGDPLTDRVILWTRLAPDPTVADGAMPSDDIAVAWELAADDSFSEIVASGEAIAIARDAHTVHVDALGLAAGTAYAYRFRVGDYVSDVGQTRTVPASGTDDFSFVVATCQDHQFGEYAAWRDVAQRGDVDAVLFTGDYIYELAPIDFSPAGEGKRKWLNPSPADLDGFRLRYAQVKSDPSLQAAHRATPWMLMWDDHEITDNYWSGGPGGFDSAGGDFAPRRAAAYQAWWEHQPVRLDPPSDGVLAIHRSLRVGDLIELFMIDTRQFADEPPCRDSSRLDLGIDCGERDDPERSLLGAEQEQWLLDGLGASSAKWNALVSPVMFAGLDARSEGDDEPSYYLESWDGYTAERDRVADALAAVSNPVVLSGDYHASFALDVGPAIGRDVFAPEFLATGISSAPFAAEVRPANPHVHHFAGDNGYLFCSASSAALTVEFRTVTDVWDPASPVELSAKFIVDDGNPVMREA